MAAFFFRVYFGLHCPSIIVDEDEVQTYLIGLKSFTTGTWPYFGPDMTTVSTYQGQICGALEGLLIAVPLHLWSNPLSPYLFLNLLSMGAFVFLGWYGCKRTPGLSPWFIFTWVFIAPWATHYSTQIINPSYAVVGASLFLVGFMESVPALSREAVSSRLSNALMGFGLLWVMQLHMSWTMFVPFMAYSLYTQKKNWISAVGFAFLGALPMFALIAPTYWTYGFGLGQNIHSFSSAFNRDNLSQIFTILARFMSYASFELPRFLAEHTHQRWAYLKESPWLLVPGAFLWVAGLFQAVILCIFGFVKMEGKEDWKAIKIMTYLFVLIIYVLFWFSLLPPASNRFYEAFPFAFVYSLYCWEYLATRNFWRVLGVVFLIFGVWFQIGYAIKTDLSGNSVYSKCRDQMKKAIDARDYRLLADRRSGALY